MRSTDLSAAPVSSASPFLYSMLSPALACFSCWTLLSRARTCNSQYVLGQATLAVACFSKTQINTISYRV